MSAFARLRSARRDRSELRSARHARRIASLRAAEARADREIATSKLYTYGPSIR